MIIWLNAWRHGFIHPTAIVEAGAMVGAHTTIWHWVHVCPGAVIGENCSLGQGVFVGQRAIIGNGVKIQNHVSIYDEVTLEDDVFCGPHMVFTNVINPRAHVPRKDEYQPTLVKKGATLGANCTIICGHHIGRYAMIGAGAVVTQDVPDFALMVGVPARQVGWVSRQGHRLDLPLQGIAISACPVTQERYELNGRQCTYILQDS